MESGLTTTLATHIVCGAVCLVAGTTAILSSKSPGRHPVAGRVFLCSLVMVFLAILPNLYVQQNVFLFGLGWLAVYSGLDGWRSLLRYRGVLDASRQPLDQALQGVSVIVSIVLAGTGLRLILSEGRWIGLVAVLFGLLGVTLVRGALTRMHMPTTPPEWLAAHIGQMTGAFSAAVTAFFAIQLSGQIGSWEWVVWVMPSVVISAWARREVTRRGLPTA